MQAGALDHLHNDVGRAVFFARVEDRDDIRVAELGDGLSFVEQAVAPLGSEPCAGQDLDRNVAIQGVIVGAVHRAHTAGPELLFQPVAVVKNGLF